MPVPRFSDRLAPRDGPGGAPWVRLRGAKRLLLHWSWEPLEVKRLLPPGLSVDLFQGRAWVGLELSAAASVRPSLYPPLPGRSGQASAGVRTYVHDQFGRPGTWYLSLEVGGWIGVGLGRLLFHLPAERAVIQVSEGPDPELTQFRCRPFRRVEESVFRYGPALPLERLGPDEHSLDYFLIERHRLFSSEARTGLLYSSEVTHEPYAVAPAELPVWDDRLLRDLRLDRGGRPPESARCVRAGYEQAYPPVPVPSADEEADLAAGAFGDSALPV